MTAQDQEPSRYLPWIVLAGVCWLMATFASLRFLPTYLLRNVVLVLSPAVAAIVIACLPRSVLKRGLIRFVKRWFACFSIYCLIVIGSALVLLLGCSAVGYLPYSDRPGPGWGNAPAHLPGLEEIEYFAGWAVFLLPVCVLWGSVFFFFVAWASWFGAPKWLVRVLGALFCGILTLLATNATGWYISIAAFPVYGTGFTGMVFGALILPRFSGPADSGIAIWKRTALVSCAAVAIATLITYPFWKGYI